jgi:hypothetical protein
MSDLLTKTVPSANGVVRISRRGIAKFQFGDDDAPFEVDVIAVYDAWQTIMWSHLELNDKGEGILPNSKIEEYGQVRLDFVQSVVNTAYQRLGGSPPDLSRAEAEAFLNEIAAQKEVLRNFTGSKKETPSSAPESTGDSERINFSQ